MSEIEPRSHPMMPETTHDELAEQLFVLDLKFYLAEEINPFEKDLAEAVDASLKPPSHERLKVVRNRLEDFDSYRTWIGLSRTSQDILWDAIRTSVERQADNLNELAKIENPKGSLTLDPNFEVPKYLRAGDVHRMPGGYHVDLGSDNVLQGAVMDRGGAIYMLLLNGGLMNDRRGQTVLSHVLERFPDFAPKRILELGCGVGASTVPAARCFPDAEIHGVDVGASVLRYAHARAEHLGAAIHFSQQSAEHTNFPDSSFDLVYSCALIHETSRTAVRAIMDECRRILRPGGVVAHLEVPMRYEGLDLWGQLICDYETRHNNEPFWTGALKADFAEELTKSGFVNVESGFQAASAKAKRNGKGFSKESAGTFSSWYVGSGQKSSA